MSAAPGLAAHTDRLAFVAMWRACCAALLTPGWRFIGTALAGIAVTTGILALGICLALLPVAAKLAAIALRFQATCPLRKAATVAS
jgi:hypothetical protein